MKDYCEHYHIRLGEHQCWAIVDRLGDCMDIDEIERFARICLICNGDSELCDFKKFGVKEKINERN